MDILVWYSVWAWPIVVVYVGLIILGAKTLRFCGRPTPRPERKPKSN